MTEQWGDMTNNVYFSTALGCWVWNCIWGCAGFDYESEFEAGVAFHRHHCGGKS